MRRSIVLVLGLLASLSAAACAPANGHPVLASSAGHASYAIHYSAQVAEATRAIGEAQAESDRLMAGLSTGLDELKKPDWDRVQAVIERSLESGSSVGYVEGYAEWHAARRFWNEEREGIGSKVAGNAQYAAKQAGCGGDVGGAASFALKDAVDKQLEKRLRAQNEGHVLLERHGASFGKENLAVLERLADDAARASYLVRVDLLEQRERLRARLAERGTIAATLDAVIRDERAAQAEPGRTDAAKKASEERVQAASKARSEIERVTASGDETMKTVDARVEQAKKAHEEAVKALRAKLAEKKQRGA